MKHATSRVWKLLAIPAAYLMHLITIWLCVVWMESYNEVKFGAVFSGGFVIGAIACRFELFRGRRTAMAVSAFLAALTLWLPVILATYGFALLGVPLLGIYSLMVLAGWHVSAKLNKHPLH